MTYNLPSENNPAKKYTRERVWPRRADPGANLGLSERDGCYDDDDDDGDAGG